MRNKNLHPVFRDIVNGITPFVKESPTDKISFFEYWEDEIKTILSNSLEISEGDAAALMAAHDFTLAQCWGEGLTALESANKIMES